MNVADLRWVLLLAGVLLLGGIFLWTRYRARLPDRLLSRSRREPVLDAKASPTGTAAPAAAPPPPLPGKIVTVRLMSRDRQGFPADRLVLALRDAGLRHGRYGIFHLPVDDAADVARFSVANLIEPGSFDLTRLRTERYPGISLFLGLPGPPDGVGAFDQMVGLARRMAAELGGDLVDEQGSTLSIQRERFLREEIIQFQHRQTKAG